jgi:hypothetical protein
MKTFQLMVPGDSYIRLAVAVAVVLIILMAGAAWVYLDAKEQAQRGNPVVFSVNSFQLSTPVKWFVCCLLLGELFFPLYLDSRSMAG